MTRIFDEKFEGAGYEESWTEALGAGCTINEDAASSDVSSPSGWGTSCLKIITAVTTTNYTYSAFGDAAIRYSRIEAIFTDLTGLTSNDQYAKFAFGAGNSGATGTWVIMLYRSGGANYLIFDPYDNGLSGLDAGSALAVSANTRYRFEVKWDKTNNLYEYKVNGTSYSSGSLVAGSVQQGMIGIGFTASVTRAWTGYFDLVAVDDAAWVGEEATQSVVPILLHQYRARRN